MLTEVTETRRGENGDKVGATTVLTGNIWLEVESIKSTKDNPRILAQCLKVQTSESNRLEFEYFLCSSYFCDFGKFLNL